MAKKTPLKVESVEELIALLEKESTKRARFQRGFTFIWATFLIAYLSLVFGTWIVTKHFPSDISNGFSGFFGFASLGTAVTITHKLALAMAASNPDPRLTGFLIEVADLPASAFSKMAQETLLSRLPLVNDPSDLTADQRKHLYASLKTATNYTYIVAALETIRRIGREDAIDSLESFANSKGVGTKRRQWVNARVLARTVLGDVRLRTARHLIEEREDANRLAQAEALSLLPTQSETLDAKS